MNPDTLTLAEYLKVQYQVINELMNYTNQTKIEDKQALKESIKARGFIVGSFSDTHGLGFNTTPTVHMNSHSARQECARLARMYPNKTYVFVQLMGGEEFINQPRQVSI